MRSHLELSLDPGPRLFETTLLVFDRLGASIPFRLFSSTFLNDLRRSFQRSTVDFFLGLPRFFCLAPLADDRFSIAGQTLKGFGQICATLLRFLSVGGKVPIGLASIRLQIEAAAPSNRVGSQKALLRSEPRILNEFLFRRQPCGPHLTIRKELRPIQVDLCLPTGKFRDHRASRFGGILR